MRLIDALKFLVSGQGHEPDTGLADRDRVLSRALMIVGGAFVILSFALFVLFYS